MPDHPRYIVWSPTGPTPPRATHVFRHEAIRAAHSMARQHPGQQFYVCELIDLCETALVKHTDIRETREEEERRLAGERAREVAEAVERAKAPPEAGKEPLLHEDGTHRNGCPCSDCDLPF